MKIQRMVRATTRDRLRVFAAQCVIVKIASSALDHDRCIGRAADFPTANEVSLVAPLLNAKTLRFAPLAPLLGLNPLIAVCAEGMQEARELTG